MTSTPKISCIVTAYNEGSLAEVAIRSLLAQSFQDFELLLVDDGACAATRSVLQSFDDPRIVHLRQWNDGLSSARNRALQHARGTYLCFLDADDSRPAWAFERLFGLAERSDADCVFAPGLLVEKRGVPEPFYDTEILAEARSALEEGTVSDGQAAFLPTLSALALAEPQSANKFVRRSFVAARKIRFPAGHFFEDMIFHNAILQSAKSVAILDTPAFAYYQRYGRPQITGASNDLRFDAISVAANALALFATSPRFQFLDLRAATLAATFKLLQWCESCTSHVHRNNYRLALEAVVADMDPRYLSCLKTAEAHVMSRKIPWTGAALDYFQRFAEPAKPPIYAATGGSAAPVI